MALGDIKESPALEREGWTILQGEFVRVAGLVGDTSPWDWTVDPGSRMADDNKSLSYDPISDQVAHMVAVAVDHLTSLQVMLQAPKGGLPTMAGYTLIRSAIEASSYGLWLLTPGGRTSG